MRADHTEQYPESGFDTVEEWTEWLKQCPPRQALEEIIREAISECSTGDPEQNHNDQFIADAAKLAAQRIIHHSRTPA